MLRSSSFPLLETFVCRAERGKTAIGGGRGGGIRTPTRGFGDRWSAVKPTPLRSLTVYSVGDPNADPYLISLCATCLRQNGQNFFISSRSVVTFLFFMLV